MAIDWGDDDIDVHDVDNDPPVPRGLPSWLQDGQVLITTWPKGFVPPKKATKTKKAASKPTKKAASKPISKKRATSKPVKGKKQAKAKKPKKSE